MNGDSRRILVVGGGVAGLCAAIYAQSCGYQVEVLEMSGRAGGLATSWKRGDYTFETCLHWLLGSSPQGELHELWREVFDIDALTFVNCEEVSRVEGTKGECFKVYRNIDRLEQEMLKAAPQDAYEIYDFASAVRQLGRFKLPDPGKNWAGNWLTLLKDMPHLPLLRELSHISLEEYGKRFTDPLIRSYFGEGPMAKLSAIALVLSLAWMNNGDAGYPIGGSEAVVQGLLRRLTALGGTVRYQAKVNHILVADDHAIGVRLEGGEVLKAGWVISAADGHATLHDLLDGEYIDKSLEKAYGELKPFPSYVQVSLGVAMNLTQQAGHTSFVLDTPIQVDPETALKQLQVRFFNFDPTFAPAGKTAVVCFLPTENYEFWVHLQRLDPVAYRAEKERVAEAVLGALERRLPYIRAALEVMDVSTPATVIHYTGNWKGSMEGWMLPSTGIHMLPNMLPRLQNFIMVGHWVMPGGGLPSGLLTARQAVKSICENDHVPFEPRKFTEVLAHS